MERKQFTFYRSYYEAISVLPEKEQCAVMLAIAAYALDEVEPSLDGTAKAIFSLVRPTLDSGRRKAEVGKQGGSKSKANGKQIESKTKANQKQIASEIEIEKENECYIPPKSPKGDDAFEMFWKAYPKKVGKGAAKKAFSKVKVPVETLVSAVNRQKCSLQWSKDDGQYIPLPTTWLNQGRWEDEITTLPAEEEVTPKPRRFAMDEDGNVWPAEECFLDEFGKVRHKEV